jgi:hypothetical protein
MKPYIFFSVYEQLFHPLVEQLLPRGIDEVTGFLWSTEQERTIHDGRVPYRDLTVFTRDLLPKYGAEPPDLGWLARRERELGVSIQRMLEAERHLRAGRSYEQIMRLAEVGLREIADALDRTKPDFLFSEDVSCFHSYAHFVLARERGLKFWAIGGGRLPRRVAVYARAPQMPEQLDSAFRELRKHGLTDAEREIAERYVGSFRERPVRPTGMNIRAKRAKIEFADVGRIVHASRLYFGDRDNPTAVSPWRAVKQRSLRMARQLRADWGRVFEQPVAGEKYVLYPIHFQPEATTLVQAPLYVDQLALLRDIAASLPIGHRLYIKEHMSNRGRRPLAFYDAIRAIPSARLLGPDTDTWSLIRDASVVAVITGTMGWEALLFQRPVVSFGEVFFNQHPSVLAGKDVPKDRWFEMFTRAAAKRVDHDATLALVAALHRISRPGFIASPHTFTETLEPANVTLLAEALAEAVGLGGQLNVTVPRTVI